MVNLMNYSLVWLPFPNKRPKPELNPGLLAYRASFDEKKTHLIYYLF